MYVVDKLTRLTYVFKAPRPFGTRLLGVPPRTLREASCARS